jgi:hypothetical protein
MFRDIVAPAARKVLDGFLEAVNCGSRHAFYSRRTYEMIAEGIYSD